MREREIVGSGVAVKGLSMNMEAARALGVVGFNLLTQLTEITTSLYIFDKQWHTYL